MATSGSKSVTVTSWDTLKFSWSQVSQNVANNSTVVSWTLQLVSGAYGAISSTASKAWSVTVNGTTYSGTNTVGIGNNTTKTLASGRTTIAHNADGSKSFAYSFSQEFGITFSGSSVGTKSGSGSGTLNTIPRATTPTLSVSSADMGASITINTPRASSSFTHDLAYSFEGSNWVNIATGVTTSISWTVPDLATSIPNATSGTVAIRCITKNGSTTIGTKSVLLTAKVPASVIPTVSAVSLVEATAGLVAKFGAGMFIQNKSTVKATTTAAGVKGSTIKSYQATFNGKTYTSASWTSGVLTSSGVMTASVRVKDSRGRWSNYFTASINVWEYFVPKIQRLTVYRCKADGTPADDGTAMAVSYKYLVAPLNNKNTATMTVSSKLSTAGDTAYGTVLTSTSLSADTTQVVSTVVFSTDNQYDIRMTLKDWFGAEVPASALLPTAEVVLDIKADGTGVGFGKVSELPDVLDVDWQLRTLGGYKAIVLENGTDLNSLLTPNTYAGKNANNGSYLNCPINTSTFTLEVLAAGEEGQIMQRFTTCSKTAPQVYERWYFSGAWGGWLCTSDFAGKVLWSGAYYMQASHTINLSEKVSAQSTGITLIFSEYDGEAKNQMFSSHFVPKQQIAKHSGAGMVFLLSNFTLNYFATKYLYIKDDSITGHDNNTATGTGATGITYTNNRFVLRYVIGV